MLYLYNYEKNTYQFLFLPVSDALLVVPVSIAASEV